jgi:hypothetical protein
MIFNRIRHFSPLFTAISCFPKSSFVGRLRIYKSQSLEKPRAVYRFQAWLPGGLYQVRVGLRDVRSGKIGSAMQWVKIPSLK